MLFIWPWDASVQAGALEPHRSSALKAQPAAQPKEIEIPISRGLAKFVALTFIEAHARNPVGLQRGHVGGDLGRPLLVTHMPLDTGGVLEEAHTGDLAQGIGVAGLGEI